MRTAPAARRVWTAVVAAATLSWAAAASAQVGYTGSLFFVKVETTAGDRTDAVYVFNSIDVALGRFRASATLPVIAQQSAWEDYVAGPVETGWQSGLADPTLRVDAAVWRSRSRDATVRVSGTTKLPVASVDDGFSSGEIDVAVGASASLFRGRNGVLADVTYWMLGDPDGTDYRNVASFYVSFARVLDQRSRWSAIVAVSGAPSAIAGVDPAAQLSFAALRVVGRRGALGISVDVGLTDSAADVAVGSTWRFVF